MDKLDGNATNHREEIEPEPSPDEDQEPEDNSPHQTGIKGKLRTLAVASTLGIGGYLFTILWYAPFNFGIMSGHVEPTGSTMLLIQYITLALSAITIGALYLHYSGRGVEYIDINLSGKKQLRNLLLGIIALVGVLFLVSLFTDLFQVESTQHSIEQTVSTDQELDPRFLLIMMGLSLLIIGPSEEFIFRNLVQKRMYDSFSKVSSVIMSSVLFALVHYPAYASGPISEVVLSLVTVFSISITLGGIYAWTEDLVIVSLIHGMYNASIFGQWYLSLVGFSGVV